MKGKIRHLAISRNKSLIAAAEFEHTVSIWDLNSASKIAELMTVLDFGGKRLMLSHDGRLCIAAAYQKYGLFCYSILDGQVLWKREDLKKIERIVFSEDGEQIYCGIEPNSCFVVDIHSGDNLATMQTVGTVYESPYEPIRLLDKERPELQDNLGKRKYFIDRETFAFLSIGFGKGEFCISESGGAVRCFNSVSGKEIWRYMPPKGNHILELGFSRSNEEFVGVEWAFDIGGAMKLMRFAKEIGKPTVVSEFGPLPIAIFMPSGDQLLTSEGEFINVYNGNVELKLPF